MRKVKIISDSCCDLTGELLEQYDIDYARMSTVEDGIESPANLTWSMEEAHAMYDKIRGGKRIMTAQVSTDEFNRIFKKYLDEGRDIVYIGCSAKQSGSINTGHVVAQKLLNEYPDAKISCIDSLNATIGEGMLAIEAAKLAYAGKDVDEITTKVKSIRKNVQEYATAHTLEHLRKAGRVSASAAFFGNLMGIKPILVADTNGAQAAFKKVKGRQNSLNEIVNLLKEGILNPEEQTVYLAHADCDKNEVEKLYNMLKEQIPCKNIYVCVMGPIIGASVGPDTIGVWAFGKRVSFTAVE